MRREYQVGVIGAGHWGRNIIRVCADLGILASVCDPEATVREEMGRLYPQARLYADAKALLADRTDAVAIAAPAPLHAELALSALAAGKHVFVEKPMALSIEDGERMARAVAGSGLQLFVGHLLLHHPAVRKLRALIADGSIGRVWHMRSRRLSLGRIRAHESVWWSFAPHDVALSLAIMGEEPVSASSAQMGWLSPRIPDTAYADFQFSNGRSAHVEVSWLDPCKAVRLDVFGTEGVITFEDSPAGHNLTLCMAGAKPDARGVVQTWRGEARAIEVEPGNPLREELAAFLTSIRLGIPAETDVKEGMAVLRALAMADEAAARSLSTNIGTVEVAV